MNNLDILSGFAGAFVMIVLGAIPFLVGWGRVHSEIDGVKNRLNRIEREFEKLDSIAVDVAYIRGFMDGDSHLVHKPVRSADRPS